MQRSGKIVNNFYCYIVTFLDSDEAQNIGVNDSITLRLSNAMEIDADAIYIMQQETRRSYDNF